MSSIVIRLEGCDASSYRPGFGTVNNGGDSVSSEADDVAGGGEGGGETFGSDGGGSGGGLDGASQDTACNNDV